MNVQLVDATENAEYKIAKAAAICYSADTSPEACQRRMGKLLNLNHLATLRFAYATFHISGISRACSHQFVRAKHLDFLQESQRYVNQKNCEFVIPNIEDVAKISIQTLYDNCIKTYQNLFDLGVRKEDARYILPNAATTQLYVTGNFQAWKDFLKNRTDKAAQWEIREVALEIEKQLNNIAPNILPIKD